MAAVDIHPSPGKSGSATEKALRVLEAVASESRPVSLAELTDMLSIPHCTSDCSTR